MKSARRGFTLVELLAAMAVFSVTLGTAALTLHALLQSGARARDRMDAGVQLTRFAGQLRADAHGAVAATAEAGQGADSAVVLRLTLPGEQRVEYRLGTDGIERVGWSGTGVAEREFYRVPPQVERGWQVDAAGPTSLVSVDLATWRDVSPRDQHPSAPPRVEAAVGLITYTVHGSSNHGSP